MTDPDVTNGTWTLEAYLRSGQRPDVMLVDVNHPAGSEYFHTGLGIIEYEGKTYYGTGLLGGISIGGDGGSVEISETTLSLSGVDEQTLEMLDTSVKGGTVLIRQAFLRPDMTVDMIVEVDNADMDYLKWTVSDGVGTIVLTALGGFRELRHRSTAHWDPEEQDNYLITLGEDPATDTGFDMMSTMRNTIIVSQAS